jgi:hypothetical protein
MMTPTRARITRLKIETQIYGACQIARSALGGKGGKKTHDPLAPGNTGTWRRDVETVVDYGHG